jgi:hypothetical protein
VDFWSKSNHGTIDDILSPQERTYGTGLPYTLAQSPEATPISPSLGVGTGLANTDPDDLTADFDTYFQSFIGSNPYTIAQITADTPRAKLEGIWNGLLTENIEVKWVINSDGVLVVGESPGTDGLKHSVLANYIPGMENWRPEQRHDHITHGTKMTNNNIFTGGMLTLRRAGERVYELGYDNYSGHYEPAPQTLWHKQVRTTLSKLATMLSKQFEVKVTLGMQTNQIKER